MVGLSQSDGNVDETKGHDELSSLLLAARVSILDM